MKTLYVIRHAKSSWSDPSLPDFERPLNKRGLRDAPMMGQIMAATLVKPDIIISSPARRAAETSRAFKQAFGVSDHQYKFRESLYHPGVADILEVIHGLEEDSNVAAIFGHNPGFTSFANHIGGAQILNVPTCGVVILTSTSDLWSEFEEGKVVCTGFHYPKQYL